MNRAELDAARDDAVKAFNDAIRAHCAAVASGCDPAVAAERVKAAQAALAAANANFKADFSR
jgi:hypothetical protein